VTLLSERTDMTKPLVERLEQVSDAILKQPKTYWIAASLLMWEAAQAIRQQRAREEIYVSTAGDPDE